jgi:hypothetical protein
MRCHTAGALVAVAFGYASAVDAQEPASEFISFLWASGIDGRVGAEGRTADVDSTFHDLIDCVDVGGSVRYRSTSDAFGWYLEGTYVRLSGDVGAAQGGGEAEATRRFGEIGVSYAFAPKLSGYVGARTQRLDSELRTADGRIASDDTSWTDGFVGLRWEPLQTPTWSAWVRGDIGAGGADSVWLAELGGGYHFGSRWTGYLAYRVLDTDFSDDDFVYDVRESGIAFGFGLSF